MRFALAGLAICAAVTALPHKGGILKGIEHEAGSLTGEVPGLDVQERAVYIPKLGHVHHAINKDEIVKKVEGVANSNSLNLRRNLKNKLGSKANGLLGEVEGAAGTTGVLGEAEGLASTDGALGDVEGIASTDGTLGEVEGLARRHLLKKAGSLNGVIGEVEGVASTDGVLSEVEGVATNEVPALPVRSLRHKISQEAHHLIHKVQGSASASGFLSEAEGDVPATSLLVRSLEHKITKESKHAASEVEGAASADGLFSEAEGVASADGVLSSVEGETTSLPVRSLKHKASNKANSVLSEVERVASQAEGAASTSGLVSEVEGVASTDGTLSSVEGVVPATSLPVRSLEHKASNKAKGGLSEVEGVASEVEGAASTSGVLSEVDGVASTDDLLSSVEGEVPATSLLVRHLHDGISAGITDDQDVNYLVSELESVV